MTRPQAGEAGQHRFITFLASLRREEIPAEVVAEARRLILDTVACIVAARATEMEPVVREGAALIWPGGGPVARAYSLARLAGAMDYDEGYAGHHFGCGAVGAALALADRPNVTIADLITAIVAGYEAGGRFAEAQGPYFETVDGVQRFLPVWGIVSSIVFAAAAAAANLLRLPPRLAIEGLSVAGAASPIPAGAKWSVMVDLPNTKFCDAGWAAAAGVSGVLLAGSGTTGLTNLLDAEGGMFEMISAVNAAPDRITLELGERWILPGIRYKQWPCCGMLFGALEAAQRLVLAHGLAVQEIDAIDVRLPENTLLPRFLNRDPSGFTSRQFSLPHAMAMLLTATEPGPLWLDADLAGRADIAALRNKVSAKALTVVQREAGIAAEVTITAGGKVVRGAVSVAELAASRRPAGDEAIRDKFRQLVAERHAGETERLVSGANDALPAATLLDMVMEARPR